MVKCKSCGNVIDKKQPNNLFYMPVCPNCAGRQENKDFMKALEKFAYGDNKTGGKNG